MQKRLGLLDVKQAFLSDGRFRDLFPELKAEMDEAMKNPTCACNRKLYDKFFDHPDRLAKYFPDRKIESTTERINTLAKNAWTVINCAAAELESRLRKLPPGRKQIAVARSGDQVTVIVNELDLVW